MQHQEKMTALPVFIPTIRIKQITTRETFGRLFIATQNEPTVVCGTARRIGYTGTRNTDLAIYRLKLKKTNRTFVTLPMLFVVENGMFMDYEQWRHEQQQRVE